MVVFHSEEAEREQEKEKTRGEGKEKKNNNEDFFSCTHITESRYCAIGKMGRAVCIAHRLTLASVCASCALAKKLEKGKTVARRNNTRPVQKTVL